MKFAGGACVAMLAAAVSAAAAPVAHGAQPEQAGAR